MSNIKIICDSMNDVLKEVVDKYDIEVLPVTMIFEGKEYRAGVDIDGNEFYQLLRSSESMPSTSQITYITYKEVFEKFIKEGKTVLYMAGSSSASGIYQSAMLAKSDIEEGEVHIFDTYTLSIGGCMLIKKAAEMAESGSSIEEILNTLEGLKEKVEVYFSVDSLDYLHKGGRISGTKAAIGNLLNIKPILKIENGLVTQKNQVRGSKKIMPKLIEELKSQVGDDFSDKDVYIGYADDTDIREKFIEKVKEELNPKNIYTLQIGPCVACHSGPSVLGIGSMKS
ncbi:MAG: DegV family protein [Peptostreptococcaceae bacterium]